MLVCSINITLTPISNDLRDIIQPDLAGLLGHPRVFSAGRDGTRATD
jgi:hypothetical protein